MTLARRLRESLARRARALPVVRHLHARVRRLKYERRVQRFVSESTGRADRYPIGVVYETTMRCNLRCEFCYVGELLNMEGQWRQELGVDALQRAFPERGGLQVSLTGGEFFVR